MSTPKVPRGQPGRWLTLVKAAPAHAVLAPARVPLATDDASAWTDEQVGQLLYLTTALGPRDTQAQDFWEAVEAFGESGEPSQRTRLQREAAKAYALTERRAGIELRRLRRQLEGLGQDAPQ